MNKKKVLWISESSCLGTGFSTISKEVLTRLYNTNKYEIAEYASYIKGSDPRNLELPWKVYGAIPEDYDQEGLQKYNSSIYGQFGETLFEKVCLDFVPDICIGMRDTWMNSMEKASPFKNNFRWIYMPTIDGEDIQRLEWIELYEKADVLLTYSRYGKEVLGREAPHLKVFDIVRPGVNHDIFKPMDKLSLRKKFGLDPNTMIVMTTMRNQRRKLFPDLIQAFEQYLRYCIEKGNPRLATNTYLYLHTSYPDVGFDIGRFIMQSGVGHRVLVTYKCDNCQKCFIDFFQTEITCCRHCGKLTAHMPNTQSGVSREQLAELYNVADLYVQYSIAEGWACPITEAKSCGVPAMAVNYSAMVEQVEVEGCQPIKVEKFFYETMMETEQRRALPSNDDLVRKMFNFFSANKETRQKWGALARKDAAENCSFDRATKVFENAIDSIDVLDNKNTWYYPTPRLLKQPKEMPSFRNNREFVDWCIDNIIQEPALKGSYWKADLVKGLNVGYHVGRQGRGPCTTETVLNMFTEMAKNHNYWEQMRVNKLIGCKKDDWHWRMV